MDLENIIINDYYSFIKIDKITIGEFFEYKDYVYRMTDYWNKKCTKKLAMHMDSGKLIEFDLNTSVFMLTCLDNCIEYERGCL